MNLRLVALDCPACGSAMRGEGEDTIFFCAHCGSAAVLEEEGLRMVESTAVLPTPGRRAELWRPAWLLETVVTVDQRIRFGGRRTDGWTDDRTFLVPAFPMPLNDLTRLTRALSGVPTEIREVPREPILGGRLGVEDAETVARHIVVGDEVRKRDQLASVEVVIEVKSHRLVALPFERVKGKLRCAVTGVTVHAGD